MMPSQEKVIHTNIINVFDGNANIVRSYVAVQGLSQDQQHNRYLNTKYHCLNLLNDPDL